MKACPAHALTCIGEAKTVDEVLKVCLQDQPFYEDSGGGVTLSGGEARIAPQLDHLLIDLKHVDPTKLREHATARADLMLQNLSWALEHHADVLPRTPVIPGFNDSLDDVRAMARWLRDAGGSRVQLLPFHNYGESKYALLDMDYQLRGLKNLHPEDLESYRQVYVNEGIEAFF